ncbi:Predicted dehydrogenase [Paraoerskovia marina]|uniref:Predicted dehydrogenase n=1 Tax=Paraoerskovia marina TaxID=545619 RepID=A0A1H1VWX1_9CELL|nr:Gfo/Idh/MocA family oxidoreductase [Paraoerskovia marina]SDS88756.1 Predicted dehydrogenase [Paraoerskovia marina]
MTDSRQIADHARDPKSAPAIRWGILGAGGIAQTFARAVDELTVSTVTAVGSRDLARAEAFAAEHANGARAHGSYEELVADPEVDAIYVATPHSHHRDHALLAVAAGKHLLVEKAFTRDATEAQEVFDAAREAGVFVMEAMWTRHLPHVAAMRAVIERGDIGEVVAVHADHGQHFDADPSHRLFAPELAGGALLDLGVYPVSFAMDVLGVPDEVVATGTLTDTGVDGQISIALRYGQRAQATLSTTLWAKTRNGAVIAGTTGRIEIDPWFYTPTSFRVVPNDGVEAVYTNVAEQGMQYQAAEVARCIAVGRTESSRMPWDETLAVMRTMDEIRRQVGVVYPGE